MIALFSLPAYISWQWLWLTVAAFLAGVLNAVAGGGNQLTRIIRENLGAGAYGAEAKIDIFGDVGLGQRSEVEVRRHPLSKLK